MTANKATPEELIGRLNNYLGNGGFWNPESMEHEKVRDLIVEVRDFLAADLIESLVQKKVDKAGGENVLYKSCPKHEGLPWSFTANTVGYTAIICPICNPPDAH